MPEWGSSHSGRTTPDERADPCHLSQESRVTRRASISAEMGATIGATHMDPDSPSSLSRPPMNYAQPSWMTTSSPSTVYIVPSPWSVVISSRYPTTSSKRGSEETRTSG